MAKRFSGLLQQLRLTTQLTTSENFLYVARGVGVGPYLLNHGFDPDSSLEFLKRLEINQKCTFLRTFDTQKKKGVDGQSFQKLASHLLKGSEIAIQSDG